MKNLAKILFGMPIAATLILLFAIGIGVATFIENDFGSEGARAVVYNALWFEIVLVWFCLCLLYSIYTYKLWKRPKLPLFIFHISFIIIIIGAAITRYVSDEGLLHIREGKEVDHYVTTSTFINIQVGDEHYAKEVLFSPVSSNSFSQTVNGVHFEAIRFIPNATERIEAVEKGIPYLQIGTGQGEQVEKQFLKYGDNLDLNGTIVSFGKDRQADIFLEVKNQQLYVIPKDTVLVVGMQNQTTDTIPSGVEAHAHVRQLYVQQGTRFVITQYYPSAQYSIRSNPSGQSSMDVLIMEAQKGDDKQVLYLSGKKSIEGQKAHANLEGQPIEISYGSIKKELPFGIFLKDFEVERYPGSMSPKSYTSYVEVKEEGKKVQDAEIFMNNVLNYKGYRLYQSSFDKDELGSTLFVNQDKLGTNVTYIGYFLMTLGMFLALFWGKTRFRALAKKIGKASAVVASLLYLSASGLQAQNLPDSTDYLAHVVPLSEAKSFEKILVQDRGGRIKPFGTATNELLRKVYGSFQFQGLTPTQVVLSMMVHPEQWQHAPLIKVKSKTVQKTLGIFKDEKKVAYASFADFYKTENNMGESPYKLYNQIAEVYGKDVKLRNDEDKAYMKVDEYFSICYMIFSQEVLRIFPDPTQKKDRWFSPSDEIEVGKDEQIFIKSIMGLYAKSLENKSTADSGKKNEISTDEIVESLHNYQKKYGGTLLPSPSKIKTEILYNNLQVFYRLFPFFLLIGFVFLVALFVYTLRDKAPPKLLTRVIVSLLVIGFFIQTSGMIARWYISGHGPWSDSYESMLYVAWSSVLAGLIFIKKSPYALALGSLFCGMCLAFAHLSYMNPEITNLVPVLRSFWMNIHVSIITAPYGFFAVSALIGLVNLIFFLFITPQNHQHIQADITKLSHISELSLIIGLYLLAIGTMLGGVWANESWGRYWAWDPKEVWALVSVLVYSFIAHMRLIPGLRGSYAFNLLTLFSYAVIIMTYQGVNYFLGGLHSYGKGEAPNIHASIYLVLISFVLIAIAAFFKKRSLDKKMKADKTA